jgi:hypothetical protein
VLVFQSYLFYCFILSISVCPSKRACFQLKQVSTSNATLSQILQYSGDYLKVSTVRDEY